VPAHLPVGLAEEITAALALLRWIWVVDSASLAAGAAAAAAAPAARPGAEEEEAARALGVDFLLAGAIQRAGGRMRVTLRLKDLRPPVGVAWTGRFERDAGDLLALQDAVAAEAVARLDPEILLIEAGRRAGVVRPGAAGDASAYDLLLRAIPAIHRLDREGFAEAGRWLGEAIAREPDHAAAHAWFAYWHLFLVGQGWAGTTRGAGGGEPIGEAAAMAAAERLAARAIALDPLDAQGLTILGHVRAFLHHRPEEAVALHRRALALNPNLAAAWAFLGKAESYLGGHEAALRHMDRYRQLAPCHPHAFFFDAARGIPLLLLGRHAEAVEVGRAATALRPGCSYPYKTYLAALGHLGLEDEAAAARERLLAIEPDFTVAKALRRTPVRRAEDRALYAEGLRRAGVG
jgi:TolB-like protein